MEEYPHPYEETGPSANGPEIGRVGKMAETDQTETEGGEGAPVAKSKGLFANKKMLIIVFAVALLLLGGIGAGVYFLVFDKGGGSGGAAAGQKSVPPTVAYFDLPDILANIQGADGSPSYLKLSVSLELNSEEDKAGIQALQPRITDQLQAYVRELRTDDIKGSAGVMRLKEEMLRRVNAAAAPYHVRDVLFKEMMVQ